MESSLGFIVAPHRTDVPAEATNRALQQPLNTRLSLWPERWPAIALQVCIDKVEAAPVEQQEDVRRDLPCKACPENTRCLTAKRKEIGSLMYDREILVSPRTSESSLFPRETMRPLLNESMAFLPHYRIPGGLEAEEKVVQAWDIAWSEKTGGDWLVLMSAVVNIVNGRRRLLNIERWQRKSFQEQIDLIVEKHEAYQSDLVVIESDAAQQIWTQHVAATTAVPVIPHAAGGEKRSLQVGVPSILIHLENRRWEFPYMPFSYNRSEMDNFLTELEAFGWVDGKLEGVGEHDDTVMCFWHLNWGIDKWIAVSAPERDRAQGGFSGVR